MTQVLKLSDKDSKKAFINMPLKQLQITQDKTNKQNKKPESLSKKI